MSMTTPSVPGLSPQAIVADRLSKHYGSFRAVDSATFSIPAGQLVAFLGPNGAGKSTTMRMLTGFLVPTSGTAHIAGINMLTDRVSAARLLGYLPENGPFYPVRGFRSASRTYALTGFGPAAADDGKSASQVSTAGLSTRLLGADGSAPAGMSLAQASTRTGIDIAALAKDLPGVVAGMRTRAAQRAQD